MTHKPFAKHMNDLVLRVAHLGVKGIEGKTDPETLDRAIVDMAIPLEITDDEVVEGAARRLGLDPADLPESDAPWSEKNSHWDENPDHPVGDWLYEINNGDTRRGYGDWVDARIEASEDDDPEP